MDPQRGAQLELRVIYDREREREIWKQSLIESHAVFAIPPGSIVRDANYVVSSDAAYLWRGIKTGGPTGTSPATGCRLPLAHSPEISIFHAKKKRGGRRSGRNGGGEGVERRKTRGRRRRVGCLEIGVGKQGGGRKRHDKNNGLEQEEKEDGITRGTIVGRKIANKRRRGGWKRGEIRSERVGKI